jgi:hypothetical protein
MVKLFRRALVSRNRRNVVKATGACIDKNKSGSSLQLLLYMIPEALSKKPVTTASTIIKYSRKYSLHGFGLCRVAGDDELSS